MNDAARRLDRRQLLGTALFLPLAALARPVMASAANAERFIDEVGEQVLTILRDDGLDRTAKIGRLHDLLDANTDLDLVARLVLGQHWRTATAEDRQAYVDLFRQLLMKTLADRLNDYGGETFEVTGSRSLNATDSMVTTSILRPGGEPPLRVDWRVREGNGGPAIIDVVAEGISLVVSQRSEVGEVVAQGGMPALLDRMRERLKGRG